MRYKSAASASARRLRTSLLVSSIFIWLDRPTRQLRLCAKFTFDLMDTVFKPAAFIAVAAARTQCLQSFEFCFERQFVIRIGGERDVAQMQRLDGLPGLRAFHRESGHGVRPAREFDDIGIDR